MTQEWITVLGATGSIGVSTLDVVARHAERFSIYALTAHSRVDELFEQVVAFSPLFAVVSNQDQANRLQAKLDGVLSTTQVLVGETGLVQVASAPQVTQVMAAIVGSAGLLPTLAAAKSGKRVLLANKESLVSAGRLFLEAIRENSAQLLPIDSEHNAIFQCLPAQWQAQQSGDLKQAGVSKIILTGSGGPFRETPINELSDKTPAQAVAHPNWSMGQKISVDSATMMNKGLEFIEACWLFDVEPDKVEVVIHPQSYIHSMVQYSDGSVLAELGQPDMRTPIAHAMMFPERGDSGVAALDFGTIGSLDFNQPDYNRYPCLQLAIEACKAGQESCTLLNAANEVTVAAFLEQKIVFTDIAAINGEVIRHGTAIQISSIDDVLAVDALGRQLANEAIQKRSSV
ncbi:1-deoxy-D-xylulose-5-phosphate reductoisomerase [Echinimonas agarilytica]|uniref:1-deoxy-D-xylulose 5-phosphate reductoisomerase n=1 Tax=Echinimonas agarilytica TaxID=1215918 RepID=A0AA41W5L9_9GAMM|nr:1-deoxy-D-xylulose-5-phosphate reductoisomerase [Echinimonas agarilytica]MCM2679130.1 1-deoxy-D-xylulose-5-phosphate reductoisomerase [Echinimonas agarilytica]